MLSFTPASRSPIGKLIFGVFACALFAAPALAGQTSEQVFKGRIVECACPAANGGAVAPDATATKARCPDPCAGGRSRVLLVDPRNVAYQFDKDDLPKTYVSRDVFVIGILEPGTRTIEVNNVIPDVHPKIRASKTVAIVCDACPRSMGRARAAAYKELTGWGRYTILAQPQNAELIFLVSANPYLGDYATRDGPDTRPVHIETVYANVVDPTTGESLWGDRERVGSWFVASATQDLVDELREVVEADASPVERKALMARNHIFKIGPNSGK